MSNSKVTNSVGFVGINSDINDTKTYNYKGIWDGLFCAIPMIEKDFVFEVETENQTGENTCIVTVFQDTAIVRRKRDASYDGTIDGDKLTLFEKDMVM